MTVAMPGERADEHAFLESVDGEISFFRSIMRARPVGIHKHFHVLAIRNAILKDTGRRIHIETIWEKLRKFYDLDALDSIDLESEGYLSGTRSNNSTPISIRSPSPSENLSGHPFFREEFSLPYDEAFESIISQRRMRATASAPSSPAPSPAAASAPPPPTASTTISTASASTSTGNNKRGPGRKRQKTGKSKLDLAGLVGGDSDSSALTQESGDEAAPVPAETPRARSSVMGTEEGTDYEEDGEPDEVREPSPPQPESPKPTRGRPPKAGRRGRGAATTRGASTRGIKKKKR
ncbi:chromatin modification-related protein EAF7-domain-containing protein [Crassisporium funariophilum]|nr:chromatin modification-related protein EAF7-domain-containing protein [Crassisporium funariophilum]